MKLAKFPAIVGLVLALLLLFSVSPAQALMLSVARDNVNMRTGPGTKYKIKWKLSKGFPLKVLKRKGNWYRVRDFEGDIGWIHKSVVNRQAHMIVKVHRGKNKKINIRSGPGTKYRIVGKAYYGVVFKTLKKQKGWVKVKHEKGVQGWVKRTLLWGW